MRITCGSFLLVFVLSLLSLAQDTARLFDTTGRDQNEQQRIVAQAREVIWHAWKTHTPSMFHLRSATLEGEQAEVSVSIVQVGRTLRARVDLKALAPTGPKGIAEFTREFSKLRKKDVPNEWLPCSEAGCGYKLVFTGDKDVPYEF